MYIQNMSTAKMWVASKYIKSSISYPLPYCDQCKFVHEIVHDASQHSCQRVKPVPIPEKTNANNWDNKLIHLK